MRIFLFGCALALLAWPARGQGGDTARRPNIIFILTDDQGYGDLGAFYQNLRRDARDRSQPFERSPQLDRLAASGAMLTQYYCAAPVCAPSRSSLMLGVSQGHANVRDNQFDKALEDNYTMASTLRRLGYSTAIIGKWGLQGLHVPPPQWPAHPLKRGFDYFFGYIRHKDGHEHYPKEGLYDGPKEVWENYTNVVSGLDKCYTTDLWTAAAKRYITDHERGADRDKPFFLYLAFDTPHAVLELPTEAYPRGGGLQGGMQWTGVPGHMITTAEGRPDAWMHPDYARATYDADHDPSTAEQPWPDTYKRYATANRRIDDAVGDLMQLLRDLHIDSSTLVIYTSDNGPSIESYLPKQYVPFRPTFFRSYGPFDGIKRDSWEGGIRMPAIACWPGHIPAGTVVTMPAIAYDWAPTFTAAAGMPAPARMDGISLLPALGGRDSLRRGPLYIEYFHPGTTPSFRDFDASRRGRRRNQMQVLRLGDYVGVRYDIKDAGDDFEIYDAVRDPGQTHNLAGSGTASLRGRGGALRQVPMAGLQRRMQDLALQMRRPDSEAARPYDQAPVPALRQTGHPPAGIERSFFAGDFPWIPQLSGRRPDRREIVPRPQGRNEGRGVVRYDGWLQVPATGTYTFYLRAGAGALLRLHGATLIDADHGYAAGTERSASIVLERGYHPFRLYMKENGGEGKLQWAWSGPDLPRQDIPATALSHSGRR